MMKRLSILAVMGFLALPALGNAQKVGPARGSLVIVGGAMRDPAIMQRFIELAGGPQAAIVVIPTAGGGDDYDQFYGGLSAFRAQGATNLTVLHTNDRAKADSPEFVKPITEATGRGGVIGGSSAGASIQGSYLARGDSQTNTIMMGDHEVGFGYLKNTAIDQHVLRRNRQFDLIEIVEARPELLGIGIDENTAIVVTGDRFEVIGQSYVLIYDNQKTVNGSGRFYFLAPGDRFDLVTREGTRPTRSTQPVGPQERNPWPGVRP